MSLVRSSIERQTPDDISSKAIEQFSHQVTSQIETLLRTTTEGTQAAFRATFNSVQRMLFGWMDRHLRSTRDLRAGGLYTDRPPDRNCVGMDLFVSHLGENCGVDAALVLARQLNIGKSPDYCEIDTERKITVVGSSSEDGLPSGIVGFPMFDGTVDLRVLSQALEARGYFPGETIDEPDNLTRPWRNGHEALLPKASVLMVRVPLIDDGKIESTGLPFWRDLAGTHASGGVFVTSGASDSSLKAHYPQFVLGSGRRAEFELDRLRDLLSPTE